MKYTLNFYPLMPVNPTDLEYFWHNLPYAVPGFVTFFVGLILFVSGIYAGISKNKKLYYFSFAITCIGYGVLGLVLAFRAVIQNETLLLELNNYLYILVMLLAPGSYQFIYLFSERQQHWSLRTLKFVTLLTWWTVFLGIAGIIQNKAFTMHWLYYSFGKYPSASFYLKPWGIIAALGYIILGAPVMYQFSKERFPGRKLMVLVGINSLFILTISNLPSLLGVPIFPGANFSFIPMLIFAYGVFKSDFLNMNNLLFNKNGLFYFLNFLIGIIFAGLALAIVYNFTPAEVSDISMWILIPLVSALAAFALGILVGGTDPGAKINQIASFMLYANGIILISRIVNNLPLDPVIQYRITQLCYIVFAFSPALQLRFAFLAMNLKVPRAGFFVDIVSVVVAGFAMSPFLFTGYYNYSFGKVDVSGPVLKLQALNGLLALGIILYYWIKNKTNFKNRMPDLVVYSLLFGSILLLLNLVPMSGTPFYPMGNFLIVPMAILGFGVLKMETVSIQNHALKVSQRLSWSVVILIPLFILLVYPLVRNSADGRGIFIFIGLIASILTLIYYQSSFVLSRPVAHQLDEIYEKLNFEKKVAEKSREELFKFNEISRQVNASTDLNEILDLAFGHIEKDFGIEAVVLQLVYHDELMSYTFKSSLPDSASEEILSSAKSLKIPLNEKEGGIIYKTYLRKKPLYVPEVKRLFNRDSPDGELVRKLNLSSFLVVPLIIQDEVIAFAMFTSYKRPLKLNKTEISRISAFCEQIAGAINSSALLSDVQNEREKSDKLLLNILPAKIATELKDRGFVVPQMHDSVSIMFTDFRDFTESAVRMLPDELMEELDMVFLQFDQICERHNIEKLKTIGDAYMCAGGLPESNRTHPVDICLAGLEILEFMNKTREIREAINHDKFWDIRIGIHTGPVIAGVVGKNKFTYDVWGDAVNIASRMESTGIPGIINISEATRDQVKDYFICEHRGEITIKNRGEMNMYFLKRLRPEFSTDDDGMIPNDAFKQVYAGLGSGNYRQSAEESGGASV